MENEEKVLEINKDRIVLTNLDILSLINQTPIKAAFDKIQNASSVSGKIQYWIYKLWKKVIELYKDEEEVRVKLAKEMCEKEADGSPKFINAEYQFEPDEKELYDAEVKNLVHVLYSNEVDHQNDVIKIAEKYCKRDKEGNPVKTNSGNLSFSKEGMQNFNTAYTELLSIENVLSINKIKIDSASLEKMNSKEKIIDVNDMIMLEKIFEFVE